ncbi:hypothetical protein NLJ89_g7098 [Agrocybe chaxingu]|uniref:DUF302 domain-containing protein n=1 Tax=Agrocybe chaxingu TaxID=84603 RepID=A0A9W8JY08_9AGAR|nr:hypothetical protein NLJ89_g7098 [Agrocybe chaxingu]
MVKTVASFTAQLVKFETTLSYAEVTARLEAEVSKSASQNIISRIQEVGHQNELVSLVNSVTKGKDFLYFMQIPYSGVMELLEGIKKPTVVVYTIGNPLFAQQIMKYNPFAAYSIPPRFLVLEKPDVSGTIVAYHLPSSVMSIPGVNDPALQAEVEALDMRVEQLVEKVTAV